MTRLTASRIVNGTPGPTLRPGVFKSTPTSSLDAVTVAYTDAKGRLDHNVITTTLWPGFKGSTGPIAGDVCVIADSPDVDPHITVWSPA